MGDKTGCPTKIVTRLPHGRELANVAMPKLSREAKFRLAVFDYYFRESSRFSYNKKPNAAITCRRFGIHRSYFYRWLKRYNKHNLVSLENRTTTPKKRREPIYSWTLICKIREIRKQDPTYSAKKIRPILLRCMDARLVPSTATIGRIIRKENMYYRIDTKQRQNRARAAKQLHARNRKPYGLKAGEARQIVEFDMKQIRTVNRRYYAFCAIDPFSKESVIHVASTSSSQSAKAALEKVLHRFGENISIVNDNGSENMGKAAELLREKGITQYWTKPQSPKDKPFVERLIGTLQRECLDYNYEWLTTADLAKIVSQWVEKYHFYRPHETLNFMTPAEYCAKLGISIPHEKVS